jgi:hypothetical protein
MNKPKFHCQGYYVKSYSIRLLLLTDMDRYDYMFRLTLATVRSFQIFLIISVLEIINNWHQPVNNQGRQFTYKRNIEARSRNHCCSGKAISVSYS